MESTALPPADRVQLASRYPGFHSFKTIQPIHYRQRWLRDALIQSTLDPFTIELSSSSTPPDQLPRPIEFAFRRRTAAGPGIVLVSQVDTDIEDVIRDERVTVITRGELNREPVRTTARTIWKHKRLSVDSADRYRVMEAVNRWGAAQMHEVVPAIKDLSIDPVHQICSLVANCYLTIDQQGSIGPASVLTLGPAGSAANRDEPWHMRKAFPPL